MIPLRKKAVRRIRSNQPYFNIVSDNTFVSNDVLYILNHNYFMFDVKAFEPVEIDSTIRYFRCGFVCGEYVVISSYFGLRVYTKYDEFVYETYSINNTDLIITIIYHNGQLFIVKPSCIDIYKMNEDGELSDKCKAKQRPIEITCIYKHDKFIYLGYLDGSIGFYDMEKDLFIDDKFKPLTNAGKIISITIVGECLYSLNSESKLTRWDVGGNSILKIITLTKMKLTAKLLSNDQFIFILCESHTKVLSLDLIYVRRFFNPTVTGKKCRGQPHTKKDHVKNLCGISYNSKVYIIDVRGNITEYGELYQHMLPKLTSRSISAWQESWRQFGIQKDLAFLFTKAILQ